MWFYYCSLFGYIDGYYVRLILYLLFHFMSNKSQRLEQVVDWWGKVLSLPMTKEQRKEWTTKNIDKLSYLDYYFIFYNGRKVKVPLDKYKKAYEDEFGTKF